MDPKEIDLSDVVESIVSELRQAEKTETSKRSSPRVSKRTATARPDAYRAVEPHRNAWKVFEQNTLCRY